jgi:hypothetical protein
MHCTLNDSTGHKGDMASFDAGQAAAVVLNLGSTSVRGRYPFAAADLLPCCCLMPCPPKIQSSLVVAQVTVEATAKVHCVKAIGYAKFRNSAGGWRMAA